MPIVESLISTIAPFDCLVCGQEGKLLCIACQKVAIIAKRPTCYRCNKLSDGGKTCPTCRNHSKLSGVAVASHYDGAIKKLVYRIKYDHARGGATTAAELIYNSQLTTHKFDIVTSVPAAPQRLRQRGFNQAELIARQVARFCSLPHTQLLLRTKNVHQVGLARRDRLAQVEGSFLATRPNLIKDARILLVDDVITTGATMSECAKVLKAAGAKSVWGAAVAKH